MQLVDSVAVATDLHQENAAALSTLLHKVNFIEESTRQLQTVTGKLVLPMTEYQSALSRFDLEDSTYGPSIPESLALTLQPGEIYEGPRRASDPTSERSSQITYELPRCREWCSCRCHASSVTELPWVLKTFLGHLFIERTFNGPPCNEHHCKRSAVSSTRLTYHLPRYIMRRYLKFSMHHHPLNGANITVRMPRVMDWPHELFKHSLAGNIANIQELFAQGKASPYDVNPRGCNALIYAAAHGNPELGKFLLQAGADPDLTDSNGCKPIELFAERAFSGQFDDYDYQLVKDMFKGTSLLENRLFSPLHKIVIGLIDQNLAKELELSTAAINNRDFHGRTALCWATIRDDHSSVAILLANGADPNITDHTGNSCLHFAKSPEVCRNLLNKHANVHARNRTYSRTALHSLSKREGTVEMIGQLLEAGLDVDVRDADGETALLNAIFRGNTAVAKELIDLGADINASNISSRESSVHFAVSFDRHEILQILLEKKVDHTARNVRGRTVAHMAARVASSRTMEVLGSFDLAGLDFSLKDTDGNSAADYFASRRFVSESNTRMRRAFSKLQQSCHVGKPFHGPHLHDSYDLEDQTCGRSKEGYQLPGAFQDQPGQQDEDKDKIWRETIAEFRCDYRSPCCFVFDAPRGVCSGVISYQSDGQVS